MQKAPYVGWGFIASKRNFVEKFLLELGLAQTTEWKPTPGGSTKQLRFPLSLPIENEGLLSVTEVRLKAISGFSKLWMENQPMLRINENKPTAYKKRG